MPGGCATLDDVRRTLSILLLLLVAMPLLAPLFAAQAAATLPVCCRRAGAHQCAGGDMMMRAMSDTGRTLSIIRTKCPAFPKAVAATLLQPALFSQVQSRFAAIVAHPCGQPQTEARYRIAFSRSRQKRGPPVIRL